MRWTFSILLGKEMAAVERIMDVGVRYEHSPV